VCIAQVGFVDQLQKEFGAQGKRRVEQNDPKQEKAEAQHPVGE
jgi:hypothetical protein